MILFYISLKQDNREEILLRLVHQGEILLEVIKKVENQLIKEYWKAYKKENMKGLSKEHFNSKKINILNFKKKEKINY